MQHQPLDHQQVPVLLAQSLPLLPCMVLQRVLACRLDTTQGAFCLQLVAPTPAILCCAASYPQSWT